MNDYLRGRGGYQIIERDDGYFDVVGGPKLYFSSYTEWNMHIKQAIKYTIGRVLDIGCGAGRHSLYLQNKGFEVFGIDNSPLAIKVCKLRGLHNVQVLSITEITSKLNQFDTILMLEDNFGLFGNLKRAKWLLKRFYKITSIKGRIIAESRDPYYRKLGEDFEHHETYHEINRIKERMPGQLRIRVRYKKYVTPWFDYLLVSQKEMQGILINTGWYVKKFINGTDGRYVAIIEKQKVGNRDSQSILTTSEN